jgi:hypothetical protein
MRGKIYYVRLMSQVNPFTGESGLKYELSIDGVLYKYLTPIKLGLKVGDRISFDIPESSKESKYKFKYIKEGSLFKIPVK